MSMSVTFFLPEIHERPTGGNLFNRRLMRELRRRIDVDVWVKGRDRPTGTVDSSIDMRVGVIDSLLLKEVERFPVWANRLELDRLVLVVHYLNLVDPDRANRPAARKERRCLPHFDGFVTTSRFVKQQLSEESIPPGRIAVIRPGLEESFRRSVDSELRDPPRILTVASFLPGKRLIEAVNTLSSIAEEDWRWRIVGDDTLDPPYARQMYGRMEETSIRDRVELIGPVAADEVISHYDAADLFFLPSQFETCSMVTMEAMARGLPVVAYDVGGLRELVEDGATGYLVDSGDSQTAVERIRGLLRNRDRRARMGTTARKISRSFDSWEEAAGQMQRVLHHVGTSKGRNR